MWLRHKIIIITCYQICFLNTSWNCLQMGLFHLFKWFEGFQICWFVQHSSNYLFAREFDDEEETIIDCDKNYSSNWTLMNVISWVVTKKCFCFIVPISSLSQLTSFSWNFIHNNWEMKKNIWSNVASR
jgi:hypothetical protein